MDLTTYVVIITLGVLGTILISFSVWKQAIPGKNIRILVGTGCLLSATAFTTSAVLKTVTRVIIPQGLYHVLYEEKPESNTQPQTRRLFVKGEKEEQFYGIKLDTKDLPLNTCSFVKTSDKFYPVNPCKNGKRKLWGK